MIKAGEDYKHMRVETKAIFALFLCDKLCHNLSQVQTYPADCRKIAAVDSHNSIGIERKENINKN